MTHVRNTGPMLEAARCGARTRSGTLCKSPAVAGRKRCRMHGGAAGSGAPARNQNATKHGCYTAAGREDRKALAQLVLASEATLKDLEEL